MTLPQKTEVIEHPGELKSTTRLETYKYDVRRLCKKTAIYTQFLTIRLVLLPRQKALKTC